MNKLLLSAEQGTARQSQTCKNEKTKAAKKISPSLTELGYILLVGQSISHFCFQLINTVWFVSLEPCVSLDRLVVVAASPAVLHQIRFLSGDTAGFNRGAPASRHSLRAGGVKSALHQGSCYSLNPARSRKLEGTDPQCGHSVLSGSCDPAVPQHQIPTDPSCFPNPLLQCQALHFQFALPQAQVQAQAGTVTLWQLKI